MLKPAPEEQCWVMPAAYLHAWYSVDLGLPTGKGAVPQATV